MRTRARRAFEQSRRQRRIVRARDSTRANLSLSHVSLAPSAGAFQGCRVLYQRRRTHAQAFRSAVQCYVMRCSGSWSTSGGGPCCSRPDYTIIAVPPPQQLKRLRTATILSLISRACACAWYNPVGGGGNRSCRSRHVLTAMLCFVLQGCRSFAAVCSILSGARTRRKNVYRVFTKRSANVPTTRLTLMRTVAAY